MVNKRNYANQLRLSAIAGYLLRERGLTISVAESCTGGLLSHMITAVAGSSDYFTGGVVAYDNSVKTTLLGVKTASIARYGAVSGAAAREMSSGVKRLLKTDIGISITGIAGPDGGSVKKPVGLVYISLAFGAKSVVKRCMFKGDRTRIQSQAACAALQIINERFKALRLERKKLIG